MPTRHDHGAHLAGDIDHRELNQAVLVGQGIERIERQLGIAGIHHGAGDRRTPALGLGLEVHVMGSERFITHTSAGVGVGQVVRDRAHPGVGRRHTGLGHVDDAERTHDQPPIAVRRRFAL